MTEEQLDRMETELTLSLPFEYRTALLGSPSDPETMDGDLTDDAERVIGKKLNYRHHKSFGLDWSTHYFTFGGDGSGNRYYLDLSLSASPVFFSPIMRSRNTGGM